MKVICPVCEFAYETLLRRCPACGRENEACTSRFEEVKLSIDQSVLIPFRRLLDGRDESECVSEAMEAWIDRQPARKK